MAKALKLLILVPITVLIVAFAVANRQAVSISFDPFSAPTASDAFITAPLFVVLFLVLIVGVVVGGVAAWLAQGSNRRRAREARDEAAQWREEAQRLRQQPQLVAPARVAPGGPAETGRLLRSA